MKIGRLVAAFLAMLAFGGIAASGASATATTTAAKWFESSTEVSGSKALATALGVGEHKLADGTTKAVLELTTRFSGQNVDLTSTGAECIGCTIQNVSGSAQATGKINFTGVTVMEPPNCVVEGKHVLTLALKAEADYMEGTKAVVKFVPNSGTTLATVPIKNKSETETCPIAFGIPVAGEIYGEALKTTGTDASVQSFTLDPALNETFSGKAAALHVGTEVAKLYGRIGTALSSGNSFNVH